MLTAAYAIWLREVKREIRDRGRIIGNLFTPIIWLGIFGVGLGSSMRFSSGEMNYLTFLGPGVVAQTLLFSSIFAGVSVIYDREYGFLKEILVAPISRAEIILGKVFGGATASMIQGTVALTLVLVIRGTTPDVLSVALTFGFMLLLSLGLVGLGLVGAARMERAGGFQNIMRMLVMPLYFLSGAVFPLENLPAWLKILTMVNPLTYGVDALRGSLLGTSLNPLWLNFILLGGFTVGILLLGAHLFKGSEA
ncbi:ABC transporter permease [Candidatus Bathyarchaeota archaeon]|nr:ABC transporter permease [Candidatus Bathyarchaeota archaeon]